MMHFYEMIWSSSTKIWWIITIRIRVGMNSLRGLDIALTEWQVDNAYLLHLITKLFEEYYKRTIKGDTD